MMRCPFAGDSRTSSVLLCVRFTPEKVRTGPTDGGLDVDMVDSCVHLSAEPSARGFEPACHHPLGPPAADIIAPAGAGGER
jgi:hypothetical protein